MMKLLLLCVWMTLVQAHKPGHHHVVTRNFDLSKLSGDWYSVLVTSDDMEIIDYNGSFRSFVKDIQALDNSSMIMTYQKKENGQCTEFSVVANEMELDDVYSVSYNGYNELQIIEAVYDEYVTLHTVNVNNGKESQLLELYGREPDLSPEIKTWFGQLCQKYGIPKENILDLTKVDRCLQARGNN